MNPPSGAGQIERLYIRSTAPVEFISITSGIQSLIAATGIQSGICFIFVPHTTAAVTMNENADPDVLVDLAREFKRLTPQRADFLHAEGNSPAHLASSLTGPSLFVFIENGRLVLGTWQGIYLAEFDGPRRREILVKITAD
jgi:secondary thiamine-phosphate synthase enzyme